MEPKVSIILVNYNGNEDTIDCVDSLNKTSYQNKEIVVVDNASALQDEQAESLPQNVVLIRSRENLGFSGGNNLGIHYAMENHADYVMLLNNDTVVEPDFIDALVRGAEAHHDAGIITGKIVYYSKPDYLWYAGGYMNLNTARIHHYKVRQKDDDSAEDQAVTFATGCLMMMPVDVIRQLGSLDEIFFMYSEDAEYCDRVLKAGYQIWYIPSAKIYHKVSASSGGAGSKLSQYYRTRNEMYLVAHCAKYKVLGCCCCIFRFIKRIIVGQFKIKCVCYGLTDLLKGKMGKTDKVL